MITINNVDYLTCPSSSGGKDYNITTFTNSLNGCFAVLIEFGKVTAPNFIKSTHIFKSEEDMNDFVVNKIREKFKKGYRPESLNEYAYAKSALGKLNRKIEVAHHSDFAATLTFGLSFFDAVRTIGTAFCGIGHITNPLTAMTDAHLAKIADEQREVELTAKRLAEKEESRKAKAYKGQWGLWS